MLGWWVNVNHKVYKVNVYASSSYIGSDQNLYLALAERSQVAVTCRLGQVAMKVNRWDPGLGQSSCKLLGGVLGAHKQNSSSSARGKCVN